MKRITYIVIVLAFVFSSCEDMLDTTNYTQMTTETFPEKYEHAQQMLTAIYQNLSQVSANPQMSFFYLSTLASDDNLGGGGKNDKLMQAEDLLCNYQNDMLNQFWTDRYTGIFRANNLINNIDNCKDYPSQDARNSILGGALTLRAFYYYELISQFGRIPLVTIAEPTDPEQASAAAVFGQILLDLKTASDIMPAQKATIDGEVDKYIAEALLGRAWLYYTGMYCNGEEISALTNTNYQPLSSVKLADGSTLTKDDVVKYIDDCVEHSGYSLVGDFRNLWAYTNKCTKDDYYYTKGVSGLKWVEDDNAMNPESMFKIKFNKLASWQTTIGYCNQYNLHFGVRGGQDLAKTFPFGQGWGAGPVAPNLVNDWKSAEPNDVRLEASIQNVNKLPAYTRGGWADFVQETDYYMKKNAPISAVNTDKATYPANDYLPCFEILMYGSSNWSNDSKPVNFQLNNIHDLVLLRFADVLLMQSELKESIIGINRVRARVGLTPIGAYSLKALQNERRWELAFEGTRWNDIRRWHIAADALEAQTGQPTYLAGSPDKNTVHNGGYKARYNATAGFFKIPEKQISLSKVLTQNPGWGTAEGEYTGW